MKIIKELSEVKLVIVEMEVNLGNEKRKGLTLCAKDKNGYYPLNTAHDGRPILMNEENLSVIINLIFSLLTKIC